MYESANQPCHPHRKDEGIDIGKDDDDDGDIPSLGYNISAMYGDEPMVKYTGCVDGLEDDTSYMRETPLMDRGDIV